MYQYSNGQSIKPVTTNVSRSSCVKIISKVGNSSGTGFFIDDNIIVTCFHVIAQISMDTAKNINFNIFPDLEAVTEEGDTVSLTCMSIPFNNSPEPLLQDFALLKTNTIIKNKSILRISNNTDHLIGENIIFSGYPLGTPTMVSHFGIISGITKDKSIICVQASINKGNSGGALVNSDGEVIGIISNREGGISLELENYLNKISEGEKRGSIQLMGIDPMQVSKETIKILNTYISTGIGYARNIRFLREYAKIHFVALSKKP